MTKSEIQALADKYQAKADKALANYQEAGTKRYLNEYEANDDLAEALRLAANAAEEHEAYISLRTDVSFVASKARREGTKAIDDLIAIAEMHGLIPKERKVTQ